MARSVKWRKWSEKLKERIKHKNKCSQWRHNHLLRIERQGRFTAHARASQLPLECGAIRPGYQWQFVWMTPPGTSESTLMRHTGCAVPPPLQRQPMSEPMLPWRQQITLVYTYGLVILMAEDSRDPELVWLSILWLFHLIKIAEGRKAFCTNLHAAVVSCGPPHSVCGGFLFLSGHLSHSDLGKDSEKISVWTIAQWWCQTEREVKHVLIYIIQRSKGSIGNQSVDDVSLCPSVLFGRSLCHGTWNVFRHKCRLVARRRQFGSSGWTQWFFFVLEKIGFPLLK